MNPPGPILNMKMIKSFLFEEQDLVKVSRICCPEIKSGGPFQIEDFVHLNSGSPKMIVVDFTLNQVTVSFLNRKKVIEEVFLFKVYIK